jgi:hypothetical protein
MENMSHLPPERLAALTDEPPTPVELGHLASCEFCAHERAAYESLRALSAIEQTRIGTPLTSWDSLAPALRADGTIDTGEWRVAARRERRLQNAWLQAAAAVLLLFGGVAYGRYSARSLASAGSSTGEASPTAVASAPAEFRNVDEARAAKAQYETLYQSAALYLAEHDTTEYGPTSPAAIRHRLATLDEVGATVRQALSESPADPVINGYYLTTLGQREATLRQLNAVLPAGVQVNSW